MKQAKKVFFIALMIWLIYTIETYAAVGTIKTEGARIRREANTSSEVLAVAYEGEDVEVLSQEGDWYQVKYEEYTGYIRGDLMSVNGEIETKTENEEISKPEEQKQEAEELAKEEQSEKKETEKSDNQNNEANPEEKVSNPLGEKKITQNNSVRILPSLSSSIIGEVKEGEKVTVIKVLNSWSYIQFSSNKKAWIPTRYLKDIEEPTETNTEKPVETYTETPEATPNTAEPATKTGYVMVDEAIVRGGPSTSAEILGPAYMNKTVEIIGEEGDWYKIQYNGQEAYIAKRLISDNPVQEGSRGGNVNRTTADATTTMTATEIAEQIINEDNEKKEAEKQQTSEQKAETKTETKKEPVVETKQETSTPATSSKGSEVVATAKQYLGCSYIYGGAGPSSFDCSGFTMYIFGKFGVSLPHGATSQSNAGTYVSKDNLQPGDLVIFRDWDNVEIGHCGIYIGGGMFIHAANPKRGVVTDTLNSGYYYERYVTGRRLV